MATIPIQQARQLFTQAFLGSWKEQYPVTNFMRSYTTDKVVGAKFVSIEVSRGTKRIASDVMRGAESNRNKFGLSTLKTYQPPYFAEGFTNEDLSLYDQLFANFGEVTDSQLVAACAQEVTDRYTECKNKIERALEKQTADMFQTGIVTMKNGDSIDYKMKATHKVTLSTKWDATTPNIFKSIQAICEQLRIDGAAAVEFDMIMGSLAAQTLLDSVEYQAKAQLRPITADQYNMPRAETTSGAYFINRVPMGNYIINLWSYPASYTDDSAVETPFIDTKKVIIIGKSMQAFMSFAAVPRVLSDNGVMQNPQFAQVLENGKYFLNNFVKPEVSSHVFEIKSAAVVVPQTVDHYACLTVLA